MRIEPSTEPAAWFSPVASEEPAATRQEWVYQQLKEAILAGQFVPGRSVTLRGISAMLGVSLTPVREALRRLVAERALVSHDNRRISVPNMTLEKFKDLCEVRIRLETFAAVQALPFIDADRLAWLWQLDTQIDQAIEADDVTTYLRRHRDFHYALYDVGRVNSIIMPLIESVWLQFSPFLRLAIHHIGVDYLLDRHVWALHAVKTNDVSALRFAIEADIREGFGSINESDWNHLQN